MVDRFSLSIEILSPWERAKCTRAELAAEAGISIRTLQRRLKMARQIAEALDEVAEERCGAEDLPWVQLSSGRVGGYHYRLDHDEASVLPAGPFRVGDHNGRRLRVHHAGDGRKVEEPKKSKHKHRPKIDGKRVG